MRVKIACIVEGHGEVEAVPILLRRIGEMVVPGLFLDISPPLRVSRDRVVKSGELERAVEFSGRKVAGEGGIFILLDSDDACPATLGPELLRRARTTRGDLPIAVVLARHEYEAWFLAAADSIAGQRGLPAELKPPSDPEGIQGAKDWLGKQMGKSRRYSETLDQPALTARFDLQMARSADSFDKCFREVSRLLLTLSGQSADGVPGE